MTIQCCVCKRVKQENDWVGRVLQSTLQVSHSYCPSCLEASRLALALELATATARRHAVTVG